MTHPDVRKPTYDELKRALSLAVAMLAQHEPGDSRAVSDEFVALASISDCGDATGEVMPVIDAALSKIVPIEPAMTTKPDMGTDKTGA